MKLGTAAISEKEAAGYFFGMFNTNLIPMATWKYDGSFTAANDAFLDLLGYSQKDLREGKVNWRKITPPEYNEVDENCILELKTEGHCSLILKEYLRKDGSRLLVHIKTLIIDKSDDHGLGIFLPA